MTPSSDRLEVFGFLTDPAYCCHQTVSPNDNVHGIVERLWKDINARVGETLPPPKPSAVHVVLGEIISLTPFNVLTCFLIYHFTVLAESDIKDLNPTLTTFPALTHKSPQERYHIFFGMPQSWSSYVEVSKGNKVASNAELTSKVDGLISSNAKLTSKVKMLTSSNAELLSLNAELTLKVKSVSLWFGLIL